MHFHGITDAQQFELAAKILIPLGEYFQIQDDYLDAFAPPESLGKIGTDILDNKNSWVINTALKSVTPAQRAVLDASYGRKDAAAEARVKVIFKEVGVEATYKAYEQEAYKTIVALVEQVPAQGGQLKREVFMAFLNKIFGRTM